MRLTILAFCLLALLPFPALAADYTLLGGRAAFSAPDDWRIQGQDQGDESQSLTMVVPFAPTANTPDVALAVFAAWDNPEQMDVDDFVDPMLAETLDLPGSTLLADLSDGPWRLTFLLADHEGTPFLVMECYALTPGTMLWFRLEWPDVAPEREHVLDQGNLVLDSLVVDGMPIPEDLRLDPATLPAAAAQ